MVDKLSAEKSAKTVEEAILAALQELGVPRERALIEILEEPKSGIFGIGSKMALVRVTRLVEDADQVEAVARALLSHYDPTLQIRMERKADSYLIDIITNEPARVIGKHGETVNALQFMLSLLLAKQGVHVRCLLDSGNYRARRERTLNQMAHRLADRVRRGRRPYTMPPLPPMERRVIHLSLQDRTDVKTHSEGEEPYRKVIIEPGQIEGYVPRPPREERRDDRVRHPPSGDRRGGEHFSSERRPPSERGRGEEHRVGERFPSNQRRPPRENDRKPPGAPQHPRSEEEEEPTSIPSPLAPSKKWIAPNAPHGSYSPKSSMRYGPPRKR